MRISLYTQGDMRSNTHYGYGKSFAAIEAAFRRYSYNGDRMVVEHRSARSKVQMYYGPHPVDWAHFEGQYKIHMSQHEATGIFDHKVRSYSQADEAWTANYWGKQSMVNSGVPEERVYVYEHGIDPNQYKPFLRAARDKIRFLHIDSGSPRKRSDLVEKAFSSIYPKYKDQIELTLKYTHAPHSGKDWSDENVLAKRGNWIRPGTRHINETLSESEMTALINYHDVLVYPSEGEGFGMIPLETLATGMPTISTHEWCSYSKYLIDNAIESDIKEPSIDWGYQRVGKGTIAKFDSIVYQMESAIENIDEISKKYYDQAPEILEEYSWDNKTKLFLDSVIDRLGPETFRKHLIRPR